MSLLPDDQFYLQRSKGGSKLYDKLRVSVAALESHILGGYQDGVDEINDRLDIEIQDRKDGDSEIYAQIDGLTDRINVISDELYDVLVANEYTHARDLTSRANYQILVNNNCRMTNGSPMLGEDFENCRREQLDTYVESVAGNPESDSRGQFYLVSGNYSWEDTISIFLSDTVDGQTIDLSKVVVDSLIEIIAIKQDDNGNDIIDNFNYGFYKVTHIGEAKDEYNDPNAKLFRFDVEHVGSSPKGTDGIPSTQDGENRFIVKLVVDLVSTLSEEFVNKTGDTMSGSLIQNIHDDTGPVDGHLEPGFHTTNDIKGAKLTLTGYPDVNSYNPNIIDITNTDDNIISFSGGSNTRVQLTGEFALDYNNENLIEFLPEELDGTTGDEITPRVLKFNERVLYQKAAEYLFPPNLLTPENNSPGLIPPRSYVDIKDELLQNAINDVSVRIDTLANASDVYAYRMTLPGETADIDGDLLTGIDNSTDPPGEYPTYDINETPPYTNPEIGDALGIDPPYDSELYDNGIRWAQVTAARINDLGPNETFGIFNYKTFKQEVIDDQGQAELQDVDIFVLANETFILLNDQPANLNFEEAVNVGDYFEVSASDARTNAYAVYIVRNKETNLTGQVILTCKILFKSSDVVLSGFNYKIKFYKKSGGLEIEDTNILYVKKTGDEMTGPLSIRIQKGTTNPPHSFKAIGTDGTELFVVDTNGNIKGRELTLQEDDDPFATIKKSTITFYMGAGQPFTFDNRGNDSFKFEGLTGGTSFELKPDQANFYKKRLSGLLNAVNEDDALPFGQLLTNATSGGMFYSSDNTILVTYPYVLDDNEKRINFRFGTVPLGQLSDVVIPNTVVTGATLNYDGENWVPTTVSAKPFEPGDQVAYMGTDQQRVSVGGFRLSSSGVLQVRIS